jgi:DNA-binding NarL/FixJ family response regulator
MKTMVIIADSSFVSETIRLALRNSAGLRLLGKVDGRMDVRRQVAEAQPDIILVDEMQIAEEALQRVRECREEAPGAALLVLSMPMDDEWIARAIDAGADACLSKSTHLPALGTLIRAVVDRNVVTAVPASASVPKPGGCSDDLTAREREILTLVADGLTNAKIGRELWVTEQTVKFHLSNIYRKLGVANRTEASRYAHVNGLIRRPTPLRVAPQPRAVLAPVRELDRVASAGAA